MKHFYPLVLVVTLGSLVVLSGIRAVADGDTSASGPPLLLRDNAGKEQKLKTWKFTQGTRPLSWIIDASTKKASPSAMAQALEFREENSTTFVNGIVTLIPLNRLRSLEYNSDTDTVTARVTTVKPEGEEALKGSTKFRGINKIAIDAEVDKGSLGLAEVKFLGGVAKGLKGLTFPSPKPGAPVVGRPATVTVLDKEEKTEMPVHDLQVLYRFITGGEKLIPLLHFKKTLKVDIGQIKKISRAESEEGADVVWQVTTKDADETLTLLQMVTIEDKDALLVGLLGKVSAGYKLFPPHVIGGIEFEPAMDK